MPTNTINERLTGNFSDTTMPKMVLDPIVNAGSMYLLDFLNAYCNPNADGALTAGMIFKNLVDGADDAVLVGAASVANLTGKAGISMPGTGSGGGITTYIDLGTDYDLHTPNPDFLVIAWVKAPASGYITTYPQILILGVYGNEGQDQYSVTMGSDGKTPRVSVANAAGTAFATAATGGASNGVITQIALSRVGTLVTLYVNGVAVATQTMTGSGIYDSSAQRVKIGAGFKGTVYRVAEENLTVSAAAAGKTTAAQALAQVVLDYTVNIGRFA